MSFVKLDCGILNSTLWIDREAREMFITALLMAEPIELREAMPTIKLGSLEPGDYTVPAGWYGFVPAASVGIITACGIDRGKGMEALRRLGEPDVESRSKDHEGRRLVRIDGGFILLNYDKYRERDYGSAERSRRYRERVKQESANGVTGVTGVTRTRDITQAEAEAEAERVGGADAPTGRGSRLPEDFLLSTARRQYATSEGIQDPERVFAKFRDYWTAASGSKAVKRDWDATWRNWVRSEAERLPGRRQQGGADNGLPFAN